MVFTAGNYQTGTIYLKSNVTLHLEEGATLLGSTNPWDYEKDPYIRWMSMIFAVKQQNIGITGKGTINGRGFQTANNMVDYIQRGIYEDPLKLGRPNETNRPQNIYFRECENVTIKDITCGTRQAGTRHTTSVRIFMSTESTWIANPIGIMTVSMW